MSKTQKCQMCGDFYQGDRMHGKFCSNKCRQRNYRERRRERKKTRMDAWRKFNGHSFTPVTPAIAAVTSMAPPALGDGRHHSNASSSSTKTPRNFLDDIPQILKPCGEVKVSRGGKAATHE